MDMPKPNLNTSIFSALENSQSAWDHACNSDFKEELFNRAIELAFLEDLGPTYTDLTTSALDHTDKETRAIIYCKSQPAIIAGVSLIEPVFQKIGSKTMVKPLVVEGYRVSQAPVAIAQIMGLTSHILASERIALNLLQRMCAVATTTSLFVEKAKKHNIAISDTRKTTPGLRIFEKYAVLVGGGQNHRFGLNDAILIKDNHIQMAGSITHAVKLLRLQYANKQLEVECTSLEEVKESLNLQVDRILLDNMSTNLVKEAVTLIQEQCLVEVSGGVNLSNIDGYLIKGVNAISVGALTHSTVNIDLSLEVENQ
jgi:nicotinate-nucleotide pyrophosphorylase (carboxylating)